MNDYCQNCQQESNLNFILDCECRLNLCTDCFEIIHEKGFVIDFYHGFNCKGKLLAGVNKKVQKVKLA